MGDHQSSWLGRFQTRALVTVEQKLGLEPKKAKIVFVALVMFALLFVAYVANTFLAGETSEYVPNSISDEGSSSSSASSGSSNLFADDGGDDEDGGEEGGGGGNDGGEDEEDSTGEDDEESSSPAKRQVSRMDEEDDAEAEALKPKQLKLWEDRDKTFMKFFTKHRKDSEIAAHFQMLEDTFKDLKLIRTVNIGSTYEKKSILAYVIGKGKSGRGILVHATERGDEWIGNMALAYFAQRLLQKYALAPAVTKVVNSLTIYLVPVANPDGLSYALSSSSKTHREWFMNRALNTEKKHGVDVSHDFEAFTQLESQALKSFAKKYADNIHAFANVRCCGGAVSIPKPALCPKPGEQKEVASKVAAARSKLGSYKYQTRFTDQETTTSPAYAFKELNVALTFTLEAHTASSTSTPGDIKSSDILTASQNITMGLMEMAKFVAVDFPHAGLSLGGGGETPCGVKKSTSKKGFGGDDEDDAGDDEDSDRGGDDEAGDGDKRRGDADDDDEESAKSSSASSEPEDDRDHADAFDKAKFASIDKTDETDMSIKHAQPEGVRRPVPGVEIPTDVESAETFLYFAYGPDMLYDVLLKAGLTSAWKVVNARLMGYTFDYTYHSNKKWKSGVADIVKHSHGSVYGVVWRLDRLHMQTLLTWQSASTPSSPLAQKLVTVQDLEGNSFNCLTFYVVKKMKGEDILGKYHRFNPSRQYRNCVLKGAKANHLPYDYVEHKLKSRSLGPLFTDKVGTTSHRNTLIGTVCDPLE